MAFLSRPNLRQLLTTLLYLAAVIASLLTFPQYVPLMTAGWLLAFAACVFLRRTGWLPLATCVVVLIVKQVPVSISLGLLIGGLAAIGAWRVWLARTGTESPRWSRLALGLLAAAWLNEAIWFWSGTQADTRRQLEIDRPIVCLGDSLTAYGYPQRLAERMEVPIVNLGQDGITIQDGIDRLEQIRGLRPTVVVIELGGHDYLHGHSLDQTEASMRRLIDGCREAGAAVVLVEVARGFISDPYRGYERRLAREYGLQLVPDTAMRNLVLYSPYAPPGLWLSSDWHYSNDGLHPNERGNNLLADYVEDALRASTIPPGAADRK